MIDINVANVISIGIIAMLFEALYRFLTGLLGAKPQRRAVAR